MRSLDVLVTTAMWAGALAAQPTPTTPPPATTTTTTTTFVNAACTSSTTPAPTSPLLAFNIEHILPLTGISTTLTPSFPAGLQSAILSNALEIRQSVAYNSQNQLLTLNLFSVQPGAPLPTPTGAIPASSLFSILTIKVDTIYTSTGARPSVMFVGTVATNTPASPLGNLSGSPAAVSVGLTSDTPAKVTNVAVLVAGTVLTYAAAAGGTVTFTPSPVTPPGSGAGPTIVIAPVGPTAIRVVNLDASATTSPNGPLTYHWTVVAGAADVANQNAAVATGYILGGAGVYTFRVTVTDTKGNTASQDVNIQFR